MIQGSVTSSFSKRPERSDGCSGETPLAPRTKKKEAAEKDY